MAGKAETEEMQEFVERFGVDAFPHVIDDDGSLWQQFDVRTQPAFAFINDDGEVSVHNGSLRGDGLTNRIEELQAQ